MKKIISKLSALTFSRIAASLLLLLMLSAIVAGVVQPFVQADEELTEDYVESESTYPEWWPEDTSSFEFYHNNGSPRLVDYADIFSSEEEARINAKLAEMKTTHSADFVVVTDNSSYNMSHGMYAADFYDYGGYGVGDNYSGAVMFICMETGNRGWWCAGTGDVEKYFTEKNVNIMDDAMEPYMIDGEYADGVLAYFDKLDYLLTNGKFPLSATQITAIAVVSAIIGLVGGLINLGRVSSTMNTVQTAVKAGQYLEPQSMIIRNANDTLTNTHTTKVFISSERSGGGGGSSYSGGYHSSSGHSFSGGGRSF